jgi:hypothetical protein
MRLLKKFIASLFIVANKPAWFYSKPLDLLLFIALAGASLAAPLAVAEKSPSLPTSSAITNTAQIRKMTTEQASQKTAVRITGVVTYYDPRRTRPLHPGLYRRNLG